MEKNILDDVFNTPDEQIETFMDVLKSNNVVADNRFSGTPDQIEAPELIDQTSGFIRIQHGYHGEDYVWHISAFHRQKQFKVSIERVCYAIAKVMNTVIPQTTEVKMWLPMKDWEIDEITFKAMGLKSAWNITAQNLNKLTAEVFVVLNTLV